mgnify:CR=1 FL=1
MVSDLRLVISLIFIWDKPMLLHLLTYLLISFSLFFLKFLFLLCIKDEIVINLIIEVCLLVNNVVHLLI